MPTRLASAAHQACAETFGTGSAIALQPAIVQIGGRVRLTGCRPGATVRPVREVESERQPTHLAGRCQTDVIALGELITIRTGTNPISEKLLLSAPILVVLTKVIEVGVNEC